MRVEKNSLNFVTALLVSMILFVLSVSHCGRAAFRRELVACERTEQPEVFELIVGGGGQQLMPPCARLSDIYVAGPVQLEALSEGLHIRFRVHDESYAPGPYREPRCERYEQSDSGAPQHCQRDAVVLFPTSSLPGAPALELFTTPRPTGYEVDQIIPWATWSIDRGLGRFRLMLVLFDRGPSGTETELRITTMIQLTQAAERSRADGGRT